MRYLNKIWIISGLLIGFALSTYAQTVAAPVTVSVNVTPPYSPYLQDYIDNPNKLMVTLYYSGFNEAPLDVYLRGSLSGSSGGVNIYTNPDNFPSIPITLQNGMAYQLTADDLDAIFGNRNAIYDGLSSRDMMLNGALPEDLYEICIQAFHHDTTRPASEGSPFGCGQFVISNLEPPFITMPFCGDEIQEQNPQNILISWMPPATAGSLFYLFRMIEIPINAGIDPIDAINDANYAAIYEEEIYDITSVLLTNDKVQLAPGNYYVFTVQALSDGVYFIKNDGLSQACWFTYKGEEEEKVSDNIAQIDFGDNLLDEFQGQFEQLPNTTVSGTLFYKIPESGYTTMSHTTSSPVVGNKTSVRTDMQGVNYTVMSNVASSYVGNASTNYVGISDPATTVSRKSYVENPVTENDNYNTITRSPPNGRGLLHKDTQTIDTNKPLAKTRVRLVVRLAEIIEGDEFPHFGVAAMRLDGPDVNVLKDLDGNLREYYVYNNTGMVLDETETDENGNFSFDFKNDFATGTCSGYHNGVDNEFYLPADVMDRLGIDKTGRPVRDPVDRNPQDMLEAMVRNAIDMFSGIGNDREPLGNPLESSVMTPLMGTVPTSEEVNAYLCLKVEVVNQKFCSPDVDIFAMPGDNVDVGNQVALLKTYNAAISVVSDDTTPQMMAPGEGISNVRVKFLRNVQELGKEHPVVLEEEGQLLDENNMTFMAGGEFKNVVIDKTDENGQLPLVRNLVKYWINEPSNNQLTKDNLMKPVQIERLNMSFKDYDEDYLLSIETRQNDKVEGQYENVIWNYESQFGRFKATTENSVSSSVEYNHTYQAPTLELTYVMRPNKPEIKGRVMAESNLEGQGIEGAEVVLFTQEEFRSYDESDDQTNYFNHEFIDKASLELTNVFTIDSVIYTDVTGFFRFKDLSVELTDANKANGPFRRVMIIKEGYKTKIYNPFNSRPYNLNNGQLNDLGNIYLSPSDTLKGKVVNEDGEPVLAHVSANDGPMYRTDGVAQNFDIAAKKNNNTIKIAPRLSEYFDIEYNDVSTTSERQTFMVYKCLHRLSLRVTGDQGKPIILAKVVVGDSLAYGNTDSNGTFKVSFASPDDQFVLKITAPNYSPHQSILNLEESEDWISKSRELTPSFRISGFISNAQTKEKIPNASVFAELNNTDGHQLYIEATTDSEGHYILKGIPWDYKSLELHIEKEGNNPSYIGKVAEIAVSSLPLAKKVFNFELTSVEGWDLSQILGFPMRVEGFTRHLNNSNRAIIKGYLHHMPTTVGFTIQEEDAKVFFTAMVEKNTNGKVVPVDDEIALDNIQIPVKLNNVFTAMLKKPVYNDGVPVAAKKLTLEKLSDVQGQIKSGVKIDLEFNRTAYSFDGDFYVGDNTNSYAATVFKSNLDNIAYSNRRPVFDIGFDYNNAFQPFPKAIKDYTVFKFNADADLDESYLQNNRISLKTTLHTAIPIGDSNSGLDLKLPIGSVIITQNSINIEKTTTEEFSFMLENWKVDAKENWDFDKKEEAIVLPKVLISSEKGLSATVTNLKVRRDHLWDGEVALGDGLSLGGIAPLTISDGIESILFNYDEGIGHYTISLTGKTDYEAVAYVDKKYLKEADKELEFNSVMLISNDDQKLNVASSIKFFNILELENVQLMSGNGFFSLEGTPILGAPDLVASSAVISYHQQEEPPVVTSFDGFIDCGHGVTYNMGVGMDKYQLSKNLFTNEGTLTVAPSEEEGDPKNDSFNLDGKLIVEPNSAVIELDNQPFMLGSKELNIFNLVEGKKSEIVASIPNNTWNLLNYYAKPIEGWPGLKTENTLHFTVNGNITASSDNLRVDNINMGFGTMNLSFNFTDPSLSGSINTTGNLNMGFAKLDQTEIKIRIDKEGYYLMATTGIQIGVIFPKLTGGLIIGYSDDDLNLESASILHGFNVGRPNFRNGLHGFYAIGQCGYSENFGLFGYNVFELKVGIGTFAHFDYDGKNTKIEIGGYGYADVFGGVSVSKFCSVGADAHVDLILSGGYDNGEVTYFGCGSARGTAHLCPVANPSFSIAVYATQRGKGLSLDKGCNALQTEYNNGKL